MAPPIMISFVSDKNCYCRPYVEIEAADLAFSIGNYRFIYCAKSLRSLGAVRYLGLLSVLDKDDRDILHVTAEINAEEYRSIFLGCFTPQGHTVLSSSLALAFPEFFLPVACNVAREKLGLSYDYFPLSKWEDQGIAAIPEVFSGDASAANQDPNTQDLIDRLIAAVVLSQERQLS